MNIPVAAVPLRVLLFKHEQFQAIHLSLALSAELRNCEVHVFNEDPQGVRRACGVVKFGDLLPSLVLLEQAERDPQSIQALDLIRVQPELFLLPLAVLGNGEESGSVIRAFRDGADGFIPLPQRASELPRMSQDVAQFWWEHQAAAAG